MQLNKIEFNFENLMQILETKGMFITRKHISFLVFNTNKLLIFQICNNNVYYSLLLFLYQVQFSFYLITSQKSLKTCATNRCYHPC